MLLGPAANQKKVFPGHKFSALCVFWSFDLVLKLRPPVTHPGGLCLTETLVVSTLTVVYRTVFIMSLLSAVLSAVS